MWESDDDALSDGGEYYDSNTLKHQKPTNLLECIPVVPFAPVRASASRHELDTSDRNQSTNCIQMFELGVETAAAKHLQVATTHCSVLVVFTCCIFQLLYSLADNFVGREEGNVLQVWNVSCKRSASVNFRQTHTPSPPYTDTR